MRSFAIAILLLLFFSPADATVYRWREPSGVLVLTNDERDLPANPGESVVEYGSTTSTEPASPSTTVAPAQVAPASVQRVPVRSSDASTQSPAAEASKESARTGEEESSTKPSQGGTADSRTESIRQIGPAGVTAAEPPTTQAATRQASGEGRAGPVGRNSDATEPPGTLPSTAEDWLRVDMRQSLAARREPPPVIVSIVTPSAQPLSTSRRLTSASTVGMPAEPGSGSAIASPRTASLSRFGSSTTGSPARSSVARSSLFGPQSMGMMGSQNLLDNFH